MIPFGCGEQDANDSASERWRIQADTGGNTRQEWRKSLTFRHLSATTVTHNVGMTVVDRLQGSHITFRASDILVAALSERARNSGVSVSEYLRGVVRERVGLN